MTRPLVIGIGNEYRGDDGAGILAARRLARLLQGSADVREMSGEGAALMEAWKNAPSVIVVDAVQAGGNPGAIHHLNAARDELPGRFFRYSTHAFSLAEAVELSRAMNRLPREFLVFGIEGLTYEAGAGLSPAVAEAVESVVAEIEATIRKGAREHA